MRTIGEFYKEEILAKKGVVVRDLPSGAGETRIVRDLFGWRLCSGKECIECRSEEEARYLKIFLDAGVREIGVPADDQLLKDILPRLERLKSRTFAIIDSYLETVLNRKIRERVRHDVLAEITKFQDDSPSGETVSPTH
ncbi:MAG: hypothetical protein HY673_20325 [Chloroflexi bacterium]|nr:hypothetical protein [Chloroflexota bacterium]